MNNIGFKMNSSKGDRILEKIKNTPKLNLVDVKVLNKVNGTSKYDEFVNSNESSVLKLENNEIHDSKETISNTDEITFGVRWDKSSSETDIDLDVAAMFLDNNGKITTTKHVFFYNNRSGKGIYVSRDNRNGDGSGDDETITVKLDDIDPSIQKILFIVSLHEGKEKNQTFGITQNAYATLRNITSDGNTINLIELCKLNLKENYSMSTSVIVGKLSRENSGWSFKAIGKGGVGNLDDIFQLYV